MTLSEQALANIDGALTILRRVMAPFIVLSGEQRPEISKLGSKSVDFVDQTLTVLRNNPQMVPPNLGLAEAEADLATL